MYLSIFKTFVHAFMRHCIQKKKVVNKKNENKEERNGTKSIRFSVEIKKNSHYTVDEIVLQIIE